MKKDSIDFTMFCTFVFLGFYLCVCLVCAFYQYFGSLKYNSKLIDICEIKYNVSDCKVQDLTSDEVIFYDKYNNKYIYEKLENILK